MRFFKTAVYETSGGWRFRWWNVSNPKAQGLAGPFGQQEEAKAAEQQFINEEKEKYPWTVFESAS